MASCSCSRRLVWKATTKLPGLPSDRLYWSFELRAFSLIACAYFVSTVARCVRNWARAWGLSVPLPIVCCQPLRSPCTTAPTALLGRQGGSARTAYVSSSPHLRSPQLTSMLHKPRMIPSSNVTGSFFISGRSELLDMRRGGADAPAPVPVAVGGVGVTLGPGPVPEPEPEPAPIPAPALLAGPGPASPMLAGNVSERVPHGLTVTRPLSYVLRFRAPEDEDGRRKTEDGGDDSERDKRRRQRLTSILLVLRARATAVAVPILKLLAARHVDNVVVVVRVHGCGGAGCGRA
jgi:hypothetical protein